MIFVKYYSVLLYCACKRSLEVKKLKAARTCVEIHLIVYDKICQTAAIYVSSIILIDIKR